MIKTEEFDKRIGNVFIPVAETVQLDGASAPDLAEPEGPSAAAISQPFPLRLFPIFGFAEQG
jgi:hypothetical protein